MNDLVVMKNQQAVTSSLQIAETFGKAHKHVIESIRNMTAENSALQNMFKSGTYLSKQNTLSIIRRWDKWYQKHYST